MFAMVKSTDNFIALEANPSIQYEHGSEAFAKIISLYVKSSIQTIENRQGTFQETVTIYVPGTLDHSADHCTSTLPSACVVSDRLSMSPNILDQQERISGIPAHELSHLQLTQTVGFWNYQLKIPSWKRDLKGINRIQPKALIEQWRPGLDAFRRYFQIESRNDQFGQFTLH